MKKIWLRKEREDSKLESEKDLHCKLKDAKELNTSINIDKNNNSNSNNNNNNNNNSSNDKIVTDNLLKLHVTDIPSVNDLKKGIDKSDTNPCGPTNGDESKNIHPILSLLSDNHVVVPSNEAYSGTLYSSPIIQPTYILALGQPDYSTFTHRDPPHHHQQQQAQTHLIPNGFAFLQITNVGNHSTNQSDSDSYPTNHSNPDSYSTHPTSSNHSISNANNQSAKKNLKSNSQSQSELCDEIKSTVNGKRALEKYLDSMKQMPKFDPPHFPYPLRLAHNERSNEAIMNYYHCLNNELITATAVSKDVSRSSYPIQPPSSSPPITSYRKRAPNSPLEIPITPTTSNYTDPGSNSIFSRAFVVPRHMIKLTNGNEGHHPKANNYWLDKHSTSRCINVIESGKGAPSEPPVKSLIPTMIADMNDMDVDNGNTTNHNKKNSKYCGKDKIASGSIKFFGSNDNISEPQVEKASPGCKPRYSTVVSSSSSPMSRSDIHLSGKEHLIPKESQNYNKREDDSLISDNKITPSSFNNNNDNSLKSIRDHYKDNNNNNVLSTKPSPHVPVTMGNHGERMFGSSAIAVTNDNTHFPVSSGSQKDHTFNQPLPPVPPTTTGRGKGRPSKISSQSGTETCSTSGIRSVIKCPTCSKVFNNSSALAKHKLTHSDERKYSCQLCSKAFKRQDHLNGHMMTHSSKKPFECKFLGCSKSYCDARSLRRHLENHHQDSINSCNGSTVNIGNGKADDGATTSATSSSDPSVSHAMDNNGNQKVVWSPGFNPLDEPKPVRCHVCGRCFKNVPALNGHMRLHGGYVNRDVDEAGNKQQPSSSSEISTVSSSSSSSLVVDIESSYKASELKPQQQLADSTQSRTSSLESLPSTKSCGSAIDSSDAMKYWSFTKDQSDTAKFKSNSLPREEPKNKDGPMRGFMWSGENANSLNQNRRNLDMERNVVNGNESSLSMSKSFHHSISSMLEWNKEEEIHRHMYNNYYNSLEHMNFRGNLSEHPQHYEVANHFSLYNNAFNMTPLTFPLKNMEKLSDVECRENSSSATDDRHNMKTFSTLQDNEISPKRLEASSLYQRRLRKFSEKSPNSDENSRQSVEVSSPLGSDKSSEKDSEISIGNDIHDNKSCHSNDYIDPVTRKDNNYGRKVEMIRKGIPSDHQKPKDIMMKNESSNYKFAQARTNCDSKFSNDPSLLYLSQTHHPYQVVIKPPITAMSASTTTNDIIINSSGGSSFTQLAGPSGTYTNDNPSMMHQPSHSSLPCTPYTAHTPYTPRTNEPTSPKQASFFQFPPFHQHEGTTPEGANGTKMPTLGVETAFVPESCMQAARIPRVYDTLPEGASCDDVNRQQDLIDHINSKMMSGKIQKEAALPGNCAMKSCQKRDVKLEIYENKDRIEKESVQYHNESAHLNYLKARGKNVKKGSSNENDSETSDEKFLQPQQKEKLSARRKTRPAPLVLHPPSSHERYLRYQSQLRSPRIMNNLFVTNNNLSLPPYTPPPMLSPARSGTGLYWNTLLSSGSSVDSGYSRGSVQFVNNSTSSITNDTPYKFLPGTGDSGVFCQPDCGLKSSAPDVDNRNSHLTSKNVTSAHDTIGQVIKPHINVGEDFQAIIPQLKAGKCNQKERARLLQRLGSDVAKVSDDKSLSKWTDGESSNFSRAILTVDKDFNKISKLVNTKPIKECIQFYYSWKKQNMSEYRKLKIMRRKREGGYHLRPKTIEKKQK